MGAGDIARVAHGAAHIGHMAAHTAQTGAKAAGAAAHAGQGAVCGVIGGAASLDAAGNAAKRAKAGVMEDMASGASGATMGGANRAGAAAFFKSVGSSMGQHFSDKAVKALTGKERDHKDAIGQTKGHLKLGQEFSHYEEGIGMVTRKATREDVFQREKELAGEKADSTRGASLAKYGNKTDKDRNVDPNEAYNHPENGK